MNSPDAERILHCLREWAQDGAAKIDARAAELTDGELARMETLRSVANRITEELRPQTTAKRSGAYKEGAL